MTFTDIARQIMRLDGMVVMQLDQLEVAPQTDHVIPEVVAEILMANY